MPPVAKRPDQVCTLLADAVSDGDLDAALVHYEASAVIAPASGSILSGTEEIRRMLAAAVASRRRYSVAPRQTLDFGGLAIVIGDWFTDAITADGRSGGFRSVVRCGPDGTWRIVTESFRTA